MTHEHHPANVLNGQVKLITSQEELEGLHSFWASVQRYPAADYEFFNLIAQVRPNVVSPCVLALFRNGEPAALVTGRIELGKMPIRFGYANLGSIPVRQLVLIAGGYMGERTEANWRDLLTGVDALLRGPELDLACFERLMVGSTEYESVLQKFKRSRLGPLEASRHWLFRPPFKWDDYLKSRPSKHRYQLKGFPKALDRDFASQWRIKSYCSPEETMEFIDAAESIARNTYQRGLKVGFCRNEETIRRVRLDARCGRLAGYVLFIRDEPKAFSYAFTYKGVLYLAATGYDPAYRTYRLGTIVMMKIFQDFCGNTVEVIDFGEGDADYKERFGSDCFLESSVCVFSRSARGRWLRGLRTATVAGAKFGEQLLSLLQIKQQVKTRWRHRLEHKE